MSLESALEEERLSVIKLLEEQEKKKNNRKNRVHGSSGRSRSQPPPAGEQKHSSQHAQHHRHSHGHRPVSLLLNDEPLPAQQSSTSKYYDPGDPLASPDTYYYSPDVLRPTLGRRSPSPNARASASASSSSNRQQRPSHYRSASQGSVEQRRNQSIEEYSQNFKHAYRRLSHSNMAKSEGVLGQMYGSRSGSASSAAAGNMAHRLQKDYESESSSSSSDEDNDDDDEDQESSLVESAHSSLIIDDANRSMSNHIPQSESPANVKRLKYKSLLDVELPPGTIPPPSMAEYAAYKRRIIHPNTAFDTNVQDDQEVTPYTSDTEEMRDAKKAANLQMSISPIHTIVQAKRTIRTMCRGDLPLLSDPSTPKQKSFIVSTDLSPEATHALEWTIGTVIRDGNVLYVMCAMEDDGAPSSAQEDERLQAIESITKEVARLLRKTRLQVHVVLEVIHCKSPKHRLTEVIDHVTPTLVILGSRGRSAIKGVLLGSFSNYIVEKSSVPVMVARRKLQKTKNKGLNVRLANNLRQQAVISLSSAKVD